MTLLSQRMKTLACERDRTELLLRLKALQLTSPRRWGRMSVHQMVCHVADSFRMCLGEMPVRLAVTPLTRTILKWWAIEVPLPWPPGIRTRPEVDQLRGGGSKPVDFARDVAELERLVGQITAPEVTFARCHPLFGPMTNATWLRWGYRHMDHHLRQFGV